MDCELEACDRDLELEDAGVDAVEEGGSPCEVEDIQATVICEQIGISQTVGSRRTMSKQEGVEDGRGEERLRCGGDVQASRIAFHPGLRANS